MDASIRIPADLGQLTVEKTVDRHFSTPASGSQSEAGPERNELAKNLPSSWLASAI